jgi:hypothetical protein
MRSRALVAGPALLAGGLLAAGTAVPAVAGPGPHAVGPYRVKELRVVSGPSPFPAGCPGARFDNTHVAGYETEPMISVNPASLRNLVATWKQDTAPVAAARTDLVASSLDGGKTWARRAIPGLTVCTGGTADATSDPWISAAGDGTVYFSGVPGDLSSLPPPIAVVASRSRDGGRTWPTPVTVAPPLVGNDTDRITGSPTLAGHAYLAWANFTGVVPRTNTLEFSRTTNGGATWSRPVPIDQPGPFAGDYAPRILVLPGGTLLAVFARADAELELFQFYAARSLDEGRTWQPAVLAGARPLTPPLIDPGTGAELPQPVYPSAAAGPDGSVYIAFEDSTSPASGAIGILRSRDGGRTWTAGTLPGVSAFAFEPAIAVDSHGTVGVTWYDMRNDRPGDDALTADMWFAHSGDHGATWRQTHIAGPTDLRPADLPVANYVGEYQGLAALRGRGFAAIFTLAAPQARNGPTDIFVARIAPG